MNGEWGGKRTAREKKCVGGRKGGPLYRCNTSDFSVIQNPFIFVLQQQQRPDLARLMQLSAQAQVAPGGPAANAAAAAAAAASLPPGLLAGHPGAAPGAAAAAAAAAGAPPGLPSTLSLLASAIPTSLAQQAAAANAAVAANPAAAAAAANLPHPAFASLLAQQKPGPGSLQEAVAKAKEEELKRAMETNGGEFKKCMATDRSVLSQMDFVGIE